MKDPSTRMSCYKCVVYVCASFPGGTNERLLAKFHAQHQSSSYYGVPQMKEDVFLIVHYAGLVKYHIQVSDTPDRHNSDVTTAMTVVTQKTVMMLLTLRGHYCQQWWQ